MVELTGEQTEYVVDCVRRMLERQSFSDWYTTGNFDDYLTGERKIEMREINQELEKLIFGYKKERNRKS